MPSSSNRAVAAAPLHADHGAAAPGSSIAWLVIGSGVVAALHVGKLPPVIPVLRTELGLTLVQAGFLLSVMQVAGMLLGVLAGLLADRMGLRRTMLLGLCLLALGCALGATASQVSLLLLARTVEGIGLLLAVLPAPGLIRRLVQGPQTLNRLLGAWGAYMPTGAATAMLFGPGLYAALGWRPAWLLLSGLTLCWAFVIWHKVPADPARSAALPGPGWGGRLRQTLSSAGPWWVALAFCVYSGQWLAVVGFLPTIQTQAGWSLGVAGVLSAATAGANATGNLAAGRLLARHWQPGHLLAIGYGSMGLACWVAFSGLVGPVGQFIALLVFSSVSGLIPGTLFSLAVRLAPSGHTVSTTVGWVQQLSSLGQFAGPPTVAWLVARQGGDWSPAWWFSSGCCVIGLGLACLLQRRLR